MSSNRRAFSTQVPVDVQRRVRAAVRGMQRTGHDYTLARFTTEALSAYAATLEEHHHGGQPWTGGPPLTRGARVSEPEEDS